MGGFITIFFMQNIEIKYKNKSSAAVILFGVTLSVLNLGIQQRESLISPHPKKRDPRQKKGDHIKEQTYILQNVTKHAHVIGDHALDFFSGLAC